MKEVPSHLTRLYTTIFEAIILLQTPTKYNIIRIGEKKKKAGIFLFSPQLSNEESINSTLLTRIFILISF